MTTGVLSSHAFMTARPDVRTLRADERDRLQETVHERWGRHLRVGRGRERHLSELSALVAVKTGERIGLVTYVVEDEVAEIVTLDAFVPRAGVGGALIEAVAEAAREAGAKRLLAMITNDHTRALRFYQLAGFRFSELRVGRSTRRGATSAGYRWSVTTRFRFVTRSTSCASCDAPSSARLPIPAPRASWVVRPMRAPPNGLRV